MVSRCSAASRGDLREAKSQLPPTSEVPPPTLGMLAKDFSPDFTEINPLARQIDLDGESVPERILALPWLSGIGGTIFEIYMQAMNTTFRKIGSHHGNLKKIDPGRTQGFLDMEAPTHDRPGLLKWNGNGYELVAGPLKIRMQDCLILPRLQRPSKKMFRFSGIQMHIADPGWAVYVIFARQFFKQFPGIIAALLDPLTDFIQAHGM